MPRPRLPFIVNAAIIAAGALLVGHSAAAKIVSVTPKTVVEHSVSTEWQTRFVTTKIKGRVRRVDHTRVVIVPTFVVHSESHVITVPRQTLPITSLHGAVVAHPLVPVTVTVYVPVTTTETVTATVTTDTTVTIPTTVTISVPLDPTLSDQRRNHAHDCLHRPQQRERPGRLCPRTRHPHLPEGH